MSPSERQEFIRLCDLFMLSICLEETSTVKIVSAIEAWRKLRSSVEAQASDVLREDAREAIR